MEATSIDAGADDATDSDADPDTGRTATITLASGTDDLDHDAGFYVARLAGRPGVVRPRR